MTTIERQNTSTGVSRRSALRGAAWTATAVTVVVATPNIAAASGGAVPTGLAVNGTAVRSVSDANVQQVIWTQLTLKNTGTTSITNLQGTFTGPSKIIGLAVTSTSSPSGSAVTSWTGGSNTTKTYPTTLAPGETIRLKVTYSRDANSPGTVSASFSAGTPLVQIATAGTSYA